MKKLLILSILLLLSAGGIFAQDSIRVHGRATDFENNPLDSVTVRLKDKLFNDLYETTTDKDGVYSLLVPKNHYFYFYAINLKHYFKTKLEYWVWNFPAFSDMEVNPQFDRMEIYGMNVFEPQVGPFETYMIYFRPMSLSKILSLCDLEDRSKFEKEACLRHDTINIAPSHILPSELTVKINDKEVKILQIQKVLEYIRGAYQYSYMVQILKNKQDENHSNIDKITVILNSRETNEIGRSDCYYEKKVIY